MDGASAIITFVVVALQSAKAVHGTLSAVKDGPRNLQNVIHSVEELSSLLERLESIFRAGEHDNNDLIAVSELAERCAKDMRRFNESISKLSISPQTKKFGRFWKRLKTALDEKELDRMRTILQGYTSSIALRLITYQSAKTSASASQFSRIQDILETLDDRFSRLNKEDSDPTSLLSHDVEGTTASQIKPTWTSELEHSISRLCDLVDVEGHTRDSEDAEQLIEDLKKLLDTAHNLESQIPEIESAAATSLGSYVQPASNLAKELKLASSLVSSAPFISVNSIGEAKRYTFNRPSGKIIQQQRKRKYIEMEGGTLTITTNKRCRSWSQEDRASSQTTAGTAIVTGKDWLIKVSYTPKASCRMITVYLDQSAMLHAALSSIPRLSVSNILPMDAPVFHIARTGRVEDLTRLIAEGSASLRDHDLRGWSLLHYAVRNPPMCKYLIQNGLDVDQVVRRTDIETTPLDQAISYGNNETTALLLEADADPTIGLKGRERV